jgi:hypothetical protein
VSLYLQLNLVVHGPAEDVRTFEKDIRRNLDDNYVRLEDVVEDRNPTDNARAARALEVFNAVLVPRPPALLRLVSIGEALPESLGHRQEFVFTCTQLPISDLQGISATWFEVTFRCLVSLRDESTGAVTFRAAAVCADGTWSDLTTTP